MVMVMLPLLLAVGLAKLQVLCLLDHLSKMAYLHILIGVLQEFNSVWYNIHAHRCHVSKTDTKYVIK